MPRKKSKITNKKSGIVGKRNYIRNFFIAFLTILIISFLFSPAADVNPKWQEPVRIKSENGILNVNLTAAKSMVTIGGKSQESEVYNGNYINDTWEVKGGDTIKVHLVNNLAEPTNLHFHGSHVSPKGNSDNVLLDIKPGETFDYEYKLPLNHPQGLYWYHPHLHTFTDEQVGDGMVGAIEVRGDLDELPGIKGIPEKLMVLTSDDSGNNVNYLVNNQKNPTMYVRPFQTVRLSMVNASADDFYDVHIPGEKLHIISRDGNTLSKVQDVDSEVLAPGDRIEVLFQAGSWQTYTIQSIKYNQGFFTYPTQTFMKIQVAGFPVIPKPLPNTLLPITDLRNAHIDNIRTLVFSEGGTAENTTFLFDGKEFDPHVVNQVITLGTTEEWHLVNNSGEVHPFHIHINPYQVISVNGKPVDRFGYDDTYPVPAHGTVVIRTRYTDFDGKYVLHCHILFHEDHGMMQLVEIVKPGIDVALDNGKPEREGMSEMKMEQTKKQNPQSSRSKQHATPMSM